MRGPPPAATPHGGRLVAQFLLQSFA